MGKRIDPPVDADWLHEHYVNQHWSIRAIAAYIGHTYSYAHRLLERAEIPRRPTGRPKARERRDTPCP